MEDQGNKMATEEDHHDTQDEEVKESTKMLTEKDETNQPNGNVAETKVEVPKVELQRELGLFSAVSLIVSVMIGSGIFISPGRTLAMSGSVGLCLIVWGLCGFISYLGALSFGELGTLVTESGAEYSYYQASFPAVCPRFWAHLPGFIYIWVMVLVVRPAEVAILSLTFSEYVVLPLVDYWDFIENEEMAQKIVAIAALGTMTYINFRSVRLYVLIQNIFSSLKIIACMIVIGGGIYYLALGHTENISRGFEGTQTSPKNLALAFYGGLWAYDGWTSVTVVTEEIKSPEKNIPRSISIGVPMITCLYFLMNVAYMSVLSVSEMTSRTAVAIGFAEKILGSFAFIIPITVVLSTFGCALSVQFGVSRLCYVGARNGHMLEALSYIHVERKTPALAVVLQGLLSIAFVMSGDIVLLIDFVSFLIWIFYGLAMVSLLIMRKTKKDSHRPYKVPIIIPILLIIVSIYLAVVPLVLKPDPLFLVAVGIIIMGVAVYYPVVYKGIHPSFMGYITQAIKYIFSVVPPEGRQKEEAKEKPDVTKDKIIDNDVKTEKTIEANGKDSDVKI